MADHPDVQELVAQARQHLAEGHDKQAARVLTEAVYHTYDPQIQLHIRELAELGLERAGKLSKGRWKEIIRVSDFRTQVSKGADADASRPALSAEAA